MAPERIQKPAPQESEQDKPAQEAKDLTPVGEEAKQGADETTEAIDKALEENKGEMDSLIDEVDEVLEKNAEEFVKNYVQRGGE